MFRARVVSQSLRFPIFGCTCRRLISNEIPKAWPVSDTSGYLDDKKPSGNISDSTASRGSSPTERVKSAVNALLHGTEGNPDIVPNSNGQTWSSLLANSEQGVYLLSVDNVIPKKRKLYFELERKYSSLLLERHSQVKLFGRWRVEIGDNMNQVLHIWSFPTGYAGLDALRAEKDAEVVELERKLSSCLYNRNLQVLLEFAFWATSRFDHTDTFKDTPTSFLELRSYQIKPGKLLEWEEHWQKGLECRKRYCKPVAAFFSQLGNLNQVHHIWGYSSLSERKKTREMAWEVPGWSGTVYKTVNLVDRMESRILKPF